MDKEFETALKAAKVAGEIISEGFYSSEITKRSKGEIA